MPVRAIEWLHELLLSLRVFWGGLKIPANGPPPDTYRAVWSYAHDTADLLSRLPAERAKRHLLALCAFVAQEGWPSVAAELAHQYRAIVSPMYEAYYRWYCGDAVNAWRIVVESSCSPENLPEWVPLLITSLLLDPKGNDYEIGSAQSLLAPSVLQFVAQQRHCQEGLLGEQAAIDLLTAAKRCYREIQQWAAAIVLRHGHVGLVSPTDLSSEYAALWYLLNGEFYRAKQLARRALLRDKSLTIPRLVLASLWMPSRLEKAQKVVERLLFPEITHCYVNWEQDVARKIARVIREDVTLSSPDHEISDIVQTCQQAYDVALLHIAAHVAWCAGLPSWNDSVLRLLDDWGVAEYPTLQEWRTGGKPLAIGGRRFLVSR